jgi:hypothetical protein
MLLPGLREHAPLHQLPAIPEDEPPFDEEELDRPNRLSGVLPRRCQVGHAHAPIARLAPGQGLDCFKMKV